MEMRFALLACTADSLDACFPSGIGELFPQKLNKAEIHSHALVRHTHPHPHTRSMLRQGAATLRSTLANGRAASRRWASSSCSIPPSFSQIIGLKTAHPHDTSIQASSRISRAQMCAVALGLASSSSPSSSSSSGSSSASIRHLPFTHSPLQQQPDLSACDSLTSACMATANAVSPTLPPAGHSAGTSARLFHECAAAATAVATQGQGAARARRARTAGAYTQCRSLHSSRRLQETFYEVLGVARNASQADIKKVCGQWRLRVRGIERDREGERETHTHTLSLTHTPSLPFSPPPSLSPHSHLCCGRHTLSCRSDSILTAAPTKAMRNRSETTRATRR